MDSEEGDRVRAGVAGREEDEFRRRGQGASRGLQEERKGGGWIQKKGTGSERGLQEGRRID